MPTLFGVVFVGLLFAGGFWFRRRPDVHKRLMTIAVLGMALAPMAHLVGHLHLKVGRDGCMQSAALLPFLLVLHDWRADQSVHPVSLGGAVLAYAWGLAHCWLTHTPAWRAIATWIMG